MSGHPGEPAQPGCCDCGQHPAETWLSGVGPLCDRCADRRLAAATGFPQLPEPPAPVVITGPDGRAHRLRYRISRAPTGISLRLLEHEDPAALGGYVFAILGEHDTEVADLAATLHAEAVAEIGRCYLEPDEYAAWVPGSPGWQVANEEVAGRFEYDPDTGTNGPHGVVIDGRYLSWQEFGAALSSYEGWRFRLLIEDPSSDYHPT